MAKKETQNTRQAKRSRVQKPVILMRATLNKLLKEIQNKTLTQIPYKHPSSKYKPIKNCKICIGSGWKLFPIGTFRLLESDFRYDNHDATFCACTFFGKEHKEASKIIDTAIIGLKN